MRKKNKAEGITIPDIKLYYKDIVIKTVWYWHKNRHRPEEQNREINSGLHGQLIFDKGGRSIKWINIASSTNGVGRSRQQHAKKMKLGHQRTPYTGINSRWIKDLNISHHTIKILEENIGRKISGILCSNIFTDMSPRANDTGKE